MRGMGHRTVRPELKLGNVPEPEVLAQPVSNEAAGAIERFERSAPLLLGAQNRHEDFGVVKVFGNVDLRDRDKPDPRVFELPPKETGDLLPDKLIDPVNPFGLHSLSSRSQNFNGDIDHSPFSQRLDEIDGLTDHLVGVS